MSAKTSRPPSSSASSVVALRVPCPGAAHRSGGACLVCDPEQDGWIEVLLTDAEREAVTLAAQGLPFDERLAPRLLRLGLLEPRDGGFAPSLVARAVVPEAALRWS